MWREVQSSFAAEKKKYKEAKNPNHTLKDVENFFGVVGESKNRRRKSFLLRKILNRILRTKLEEMVLTNSQIKMEKSYMLYLKMHMHRCRSVELVGRFKAK